MMQQIYIDNFRGFSETYLSIKDVNFFIGENSTGKTSIMSLISLLSGTDFWLNGEFKTEFFDFGNFDDIVNKKSKKKYFTIGIYDDTFVKNERKTNDVDEFFAYLMKFSESDGQPILSELNYVSSHYEISIINTKENIYYKETKIDISTIKANPDEYIKKWLLDDKKTLSSYKTLKTQIRSTRTYSILYLSQLVEIELSKDNKDFVEIFFSVPRFMRKFSLYGPIRAKPQKTYDAYIKKFTPEGVHTPYLLFNLLNDNSSKNGKNIVKELNNFGKSSGLFNGIKIHKYGHDKEAPFALNVNINEMHLKLPNVGYGVSQSLPIIADILRASLGAKFGLQQPEIHLHPRAQAALGELIFNAALKNHNSFIVETHSDFIIDRFRYCLKKANLNANKQIRAQVVFFEKSKGKNYITAIDVEHNGSYSVNQPKNFRDFFIKEELANLTI